MADSNDPYSANQQQFYDPLGHSYDSGDIMNNLDMSETEYE